tara:strand:- start:797 stop:1027 length:231 start_codon:yes stop_codon:yes gene_type:complete
MGPIKMNVYLMEVKVAITETQIHEISALNEKQALEKIMSKDPKYDTYTHSDWFHTCEIDNVRFQPRILGVSEGIIE